MENNNGFGSLTAPAINKALIRFIKADKVNAEEKVNVVYLPLAEKLIFWTAQKGKDKIWPNGSLTDRDINNSPELQDIFVRLSKAERSEIVREVKFVWQNYDAIQDYVAEKKGWASIGYIRKNLKPFKDKPSKDTAKDTSKDTAKDTTETSDDTTAEPVTLESLSAEWLATRTAFANKVRDAGFTMDEFKEYEKAKIAGFSNKKIA